MKVKMGPYRRFFNTVNFEMFMEEKLKIPEHVSEAIGNFFQTILNFFWNDRFYGPNKGGDQKISVKIDNYDVWNMDVTLAQIILPMLKRLKEVKHGAPQVDNEDVPENLRASVEDLKRLKKSGTVDENYFERWDYVLDRLIWTFERVINYDCIMGGSYFSEKEYE